MRIKGEEIEAPACPKYNNRGHCGPLWVEILQRWNSKVSAEKLRLLYLSAYIDSIGTSFHHGANFAMSGVTIELSIINGKLISAGFNQISLTNELGQFEQFKNRTTVLYNKG
ncbi:hypothetical protein Ancab_005809 [Ancistrocladus abbreviatus]